MAPTAKVDVELCNVKENLDVILSDIGLTVGLLKRKERSISNTMEKVEKVCQLLRNQEAENTLEDVTDGNNLKEVTKDFKDPPSYNEEAGRENVEKRIDQDILTRYRDLQFQLESLVLNSKVLNREPSSTPHLASQIKQNIDTLIDENKSFVKKKQNVVESLAELEADSEDAVSDCNSVVSVRPSVKRSAVSSQGRQVYSRAEVQVTQPLSGQVKMKGSNSSKYVDYHDPHEELLLWEMPPESGRGHRKEPVDLTDLQNIYLASPRVRGMERVSTRARVALRMRVHRGRNGVLVYGTTEAIEKAKDMLNQIAKQVVQGDEGRGVTFKLGGLISETAGVVVQKVREENGQGQVTELIGLPAGLQKAKEMIQDSILNV